MEVTQEIRDLFNEGMRQAYREGFWYHKQETEGLWARAWTAKETYASALQEARKIKVPEQMREKP